MEYYGVKTKDGRDIDLAMQELWLGGEVLPVGARLVARHVFQSAEDEPLEVIYSFMLPRDAALRQFRVEGDGFSVTSELQPVEEAEKTYEAAMEEGYLATMTRNYRDGITNLMVGNLQPGQRVTVFLEIVAGVEAHDDGFRFRFPFTLAPSYHPDARSIVTAAGEGEMELSEERFGDVLLPPWRDDAASLHRIGFDLAIATPDGAAMVQSPSHPVAVIPGGHEECRVALSTEKAVPNRDLVLDVKLKEPKSLLMSAPVEGGQKRALAACIPSSVFGEIASQPSRTVFVIDRSGSMQGAPMLQAKRALHACLGALSPEDSFNIVSFEHESETMHKAMVQGDQTGRDIAAQFVENLRARGGTELQEALFTAAKLLKAKGGDLFLLTDGEVFDTEKIIGRVKSLGLRVHVLGIGSASQDRFLSQLARQTGGSSRFLTPRERIDEAAVKLFSSISSPLATNVEAGIEGVNGKVEPPPAPTVFAGSPLILFGEADQAEALSLKWTTGDESKTQTLAEWHDAPDLADTLQLLRGARLISDLDAQIGAPSDSKAEQRTRKRLLAKLEKLSRHYGLASRAMSLVAIVEAVQDQSGKLAKTRIVPVGMPEDTAFDAYFGAGFVRRKRGASPLGRGGGPHSTMTLLDQAEPNYSRTIDRQCSQLDQTHSFSDTMFSAAPEAAAGDTRDTEDSLLQLAAMIKPDGSLPGDDDEERLVATLIALLAFVTHGNTPETGTYRRHVQRLMGFLRSAPSHPDLPENPVDMANTILSFSVGGPSWEECVERLYADDIRPLSAREFVEAMKSLCA